MSDVPPKIAVIMVEKNADGTIKKRNSRAGLSTRAINLDDLEKKILNGIARDTNKILGDSHTPIPRQLTKLEADKLLKYAIQIKQLKIQEEMQFAAMSDEDKQKMADSTMDDTEENDDEVES